MIRQSFDLSCVHSCPAGFANIKTLGLLEQVFAMENHHISLFLLGRLDLVKLTQSWLDSSSSARFCGNLFQSFGYVGTTFCHLFEGVSSGFDSV